MLHGNVFITHCLCFVFGINQNFIQIIANVNLTAFYFWSFINQAFHLRLENDRVNVHLL